MIFAFAVSFVVVRKIIFSRGRTLKITFVYGHGKKITFLLFAFVNQTQHSIVSRVKVKLLHKTLYNATSTKYSIYFFLLLKEGWLSRIPF